MPGKIVARESTFLKKLPVDSTQLAVNQKVGCLPGQSYQFSTIEPLANGHRRVVLDYGYGTWFIFAKHWDVEVQSAEAGEIDKRAIALVKEFEGLELEAYLCPANVYTIGYGATYYPDGRLVRPGDEITLAEAEEMLVHTLREFQSEVVKAVQVPLTASMLGALTSFTFNVGAGAFKSSTLLRELNAGRYTAAADQMLRWVRGDGNVLPGLVRRRQAERRLFLEDGLL